MIKFYDFEEASYHDEEFRFCDAHLALGDAYPLEVVRKINRIIERARAKGFTHIGVCESNAWIVYFYFGTRKDVKKKLISKKTTARRK